MKDPLPELNPGLRLSETIWVAPFKSYLSYTPDGTKEKPHRGKTIEGYVRDGRVVRLHPGEYETRGVNLSAWSKTGIIADTPGESKLMFNPIPSLINYVPYAIRETVGVTLFYLSGVEVKCGWNASGIRQMHEQYFQGRFKVGGVSVRCWRGAADDNIITDFGSDGEKEKEGWEVFPLFLQTWVGGPPWAYDPRYNRLVLKEAVPQIRLRGNRVLTPNYINGGYGTAVMWKTSNEGDRMPLGKRTTPSAWIVGNYVNTPGGIAYGCSEADNFVCEQNFSEDTKCFVNFDTGSIYNAEFLNNTGLRLNQGINIGGANNAVKIKGNTLNIEGKFLNPRYNQYDPSFGIHVKHNAKTEIDGNIITGPSGDCDIVAEHGFRGTNVIVSTTLPEIKEDSTGSEDTLLLSRLTAQVDELTKNSQELKSAISNRDSIIRIKTSDVADLESKLRVVTSHAEELRKSLKSTQEEYARYREEDRKIVVSLEARLYKIADGVDTNLKVLEEAVINLRRLREGV